MIVRPAALAMALGVAIAACEAPAHRVAPPLPNPSPSTTVVAPTTTPAPVATTAAPTTTTTTTTTTTGPPYPVSSVTMPLLDASRPTVSRGVRVAAGRSLTTVVWYPTVGGPWPLVMFAAGFRVGPDTYSDLLRSWAAAGYVVAAPEFPLEDEAVAGAALDEGDLPNEPADVAFVLSALLRPSDPVASRIAPNQVAVTGHSDGAEVALAVAQEGLAAVKAAIIMSGQPVTPQKARNPPLLVIQGSQDTINQPSLSQAVYDAATPPRYFLTLIGAGHLPPYVTGTAWEPIVKAVTLDFLNHYLAGRTPSDAAMRADGNRPGLSALS